jgi:hypothetical protein
MIHFMREPELEQNGNPELQYVRIIFGEETCSSEEFIEALEFFSQREDLIQLFFTEEEIPEEKENMIDKFAQLDQRISTAVSENWNDEKLRQAVKAFHDAIEEDNPTENKMTFKAFLEKVMGTWDAEQESDNQERQQLHDEDMIENQRSIDCATDARKSKQYVEARSYFNRSIEICKRWSIPDGIRWAEQMIRETYLDENQDAIDRAKTAVSAGKNKVAIDLFKQSIEICQRLDIPDGVRWASEQIEELSSRTDNE